MKPSDVEFSNYYSLRLNYNETVHAVVVWFDTGFEKLQNPEILSTSPMRQYTHWKQSVLYLDRPIVGKKGDLLYGTVANRKDRKNFRELNIKVSYHLESKEGSQH
jgi:protein arginine N-methyltransferase 1